MVDKICCNLSGLSQWCIGIVLGMLRGNRGQFQIFAREYRMRAKGKISRWQDDKGFGFIQPMLGGPQVFLHVSALQNRQRRPEVDEVVTYTRVTDAQGRFQAQQVTFAGEKATIKAPRQAKHWQYWLAAGFLVLLFTVALLDFFSWKIALFYAVMSSLTFAAYSADKQAAANGRWRTSEASLQWLAFFGGWPGALVAQNRLRHKSSKTKFLLVFWLFVVGNLLGLYWLCFSASASNFRKILGLS
jgi:uncharacterized membrane protein YsdA (DUF1294 family)/cold shock CspA family protein